MKKKITQLLILIVFICYFSDKALFMILKNVSSRIEAGSTIGKLNYFLSIESSTDIIFLGNSRTSHHVDNNLISNSSFNMGMDGTSINYYLNVIKLIKDKSNKKIYLQIDPNDLFDEDYDGYDITYLNHFYNSNESIKREIINYNGYNFFRSFFWCIDFNGKILPIIKNIFRDSNYINDLGFEPLIVSNQQRAVFKKIISRKNELEYDNKKINSLYVEKLLEIIKICKEEGIELKIYTPPFYYPQSNYQSNYLKNLLISNNIIYKNYSDFFSNNNDLRLWKDDIHLSLLGAEKFTEHINNNLVNDEVY